MKTKIIAAIFVLISSLYFVSCDKDVSVSPPEKPAPTGAFSIDSNPRGAEIYLNNKTTGLVTPDSLSWLGEGKYNIALKLPLYRDTLFSIDVSEKNKTNISVDFTSNPGMRGTIVPKSTPDHAEIYLNGQATNYHTPDTLKNMLPGIYTLTLKSSGCRDDSLKVVVKSGAVSKASFVLQDTTIWVTYNTSNSKLPSNYLTCVGVDVLDNVWAGTVDKGLASFDGQNWKIYNTSNSELPSNTINTLAIRKQNIYGDKTSTIYIGTPEGLAVFTFQSQFFNSHIFNISNSPLKDNNITSVSVDKWGYVWVGTPKGLMVIPDDWNNLKYFDLSSQFGDNYVTALSATSLQYGRHEVWIGLANNGVGYFDFTSGIWQRYASPPDLLPTNAARAIAALGQYNVWAGFAGKSFTSGGLAHYNGSWSIIHVGTTSNIIKSIFLRNGFAWVGTTEGLYSIPPLGAITEYNSSNSGLPSNSIRDISIDPNGKAWIATDYNGLVLYKIYK